MCSGSFCYDFLSVINNLDDNILHVNLDIRAITRYGTLHRLYCNGFGLFHFAVYVSFPLSHFAVYIVFQIIINNWTRAYIQKCVSKSSDGKCNQIC